MDPPHIKLYNSYINKIKDFNKLALNKEIEDDKHLCQIADTLPSWQEKCYLLDLNQIPDVSDICEKYRGNPGLQKSVVNTVIGIVVYIFSLLEISSI